MKQKYKRYLMKTAIFDAVFICLFSALSLDISHIKVYSASDEDRNRLTVGTVGNIHSDFLDSPSEYKTVAADLDQEYESALSELYAIDLIGNYISDTGFAYNFGENGYYSGFFDSANTEVYGYSYQIEADNNGQKLFIYDPDHKFYVLYYFAPDKDGDIKLFNEENSIYIRLKEAS